MFFLTAILQGPLFDDNSDGSGDNSDSSNNDNSSSDGSSGSGSSDGSSSSSSDSNSGSGDGSSTSSADTSSSSSDSNSSPDTGTTGTTGSTDTGTTGTTSDGSGDASNGIASQMNQAAQNPDSSIASQMNQAATNPTPPTDSGPAPIQSDGTINLSVDGQPTHLVDVSNGNSYASAQTVANDLGFGNPTVDPNTGMVTVGGQQFKPIGVDTNGDPLIGYKDVAKSFGYGVDYNDKTGTASITKPAPQSSTATSSTTPTNVNDPTFLGQDPGYRLSVFTQNPDLAQQELQRVQQVFNDAKATNDYQKMHDAQAWADQVTHASGIMWTPDSQIAPIGLANPAVATGTNDGNAVAHPGMTDPRMPNGTNAANPQGDPNRIVSIIAGVGYYTASGQFISFKGGGAAGAAGGGGAPGIASQLPAMPTSPKITPFNGGQNVSSGAPGATNGQFGFGGNQPGDGFVGSNQASQPPQPFQDPNLSAYDPRLMAYQQFNPQWDNYFNSARTQLDPQYQAMAQKLNSQLDTNLTRMDASMNRRGIYTSGIAQAAENDLRAKTSDSVAQVFTKEQGAIEKMAHQLYDDAYKQFQQGNQFALKNNQFVMQQMMNDRKQAFTEWLGTQKLSLQQYQYAVNAWDKMSTMIWHDAQLQQSDNHQNQTTAMDLFKFGNLSADQAAQLDQKQYQFNNLSADQQAKLFGVDANGRPTLDALKAAGLTPVGVDENGNVKFAQTAAASDADRKYGLELAKARGGWFDENGNLIMPTEQARNDQYNNMIKMAEARGYFVNPDGSMTPTEKASNDDRNYMLNLGKAIGMIKAPDGTLIPTEQSQHDRATESLTARGQDVTAAHNAAMEKNAAVTAAQNNARNTNTKLFDIWKATGKAPAGIDGVSEGTPYYVKPTSPSSSSVNDAKQAQYTDAITKMAPDQRVKFFNEQKTGIVKDLGISGYNQLKGLFIDYDGKPIK